MKMRRLPETDLARFAVMEPDKRRNALERQKSTYAPYSYHPMRGVVPSIFRIEVPLLGGSLDTPWDLIERSIAAACNRGEDQLAANLAVGEALFKFAADHRIKGRSREFYGMPVGTSTSIRFWSPMVISVDGTPVIPFIDPRKSKSLDKAARTFVFSVMHERIRVLEPDFRDVRLGIFQFSCEGEARKAVLHTDEGLDLYDFDTLDLMVRDTYATWWEILAEREAEKKRKGGGSEDLGPLFATGS